MSLEASGVERLERSYRLLSKWNLRVNLTSLELVRVPSRNVGSSVRRASSCGPVHARDGRFMARLGIRCRLPRHSSRRGSTRKTFDDGRFSRQEMYVPPRGMSIGWAFGCARDHRPHRGPPHASPGRLCGFVDDSGCAHGSGHFRNGRIPSRSGWPTAPLFYQTGFMLRTASRRWLARN